jgi:hypothetical protein
MKSKIKLLILFFSLLIIFTSFTACNNNNSNTGSNDNKNDLMIAEIDYTDPETSIIGSEFPRILYADNKKVIFDSRGIYIYDLIDQNIDTSLDLISFRNKTFGEDEKHKSRSWTFSTVDGNELIIVFTDIDDASLKALYSYELSTKSVKEISNKEYEEKSENMFLCEELKFDDELYNTASYGTVARIDENSLIYLKLSGDLTTIQVVYRSGDSENVYPAFK